LATETKLLEMMTAEHETIPRGERSATGCFKGRKKDYHHGMIGGEKIEKEGVGHMLGKVYSFGGKRISI